MSTRYFASLGLGLATLMGLAGCGGQSSGRGPGNDTPTNQGVDNGTAGSSNATTNPGDDPATTTNGVGGSSGGTASFDPPALGIGGGGVSGLPACDESYVPASSQVNDGEGIAKVATNGKVRVTIEKVDEAPSGESGAAAVVKRSYVLHGATQDWTLEATIPGLESELIKVGDVLDFQMETSIGYIPFTQSFDQVFGLFAVDGDLLLFGAHMAGALPVPDLSFLGFEVSDAGPTCGSAGPSCGYAVHDTHFSAPGRELDLKPGHTGQFGELLIAVPQFQTVASSGGGCDASGSAVIVGAKTGATK